MNQFDQPTRLAAVSQLHGLHPEVHPSKSRIRLAPADRLERAAALERHGVRIEEDTLAREQITKGAADAQYPSAHETEGERAACKDPLTAERVWFGEDEPEPHKPQAGEANPEQKSQRTTDRGGSLDEQGGPPAQVEPERRFSNDLGDGVRLGHTPRPGFPGLSRAPLPGLREPREKSTETGCPSPDNARKHGRSDNTALEKRAACLAVFSPGSARCAGNAFALTSALRKRASATRRLIAASVARWA